MDKEGMSMQALVVGGTGGMGQGVARDLIKQDEIKKVVLGDIIIDPSRVQDKLRASEKVSLSRIDVNDYNGLVKVIKDATRRLSPSPGQLWKRRSII
jgi:saccharopine dehydrogenase-like NADP-dependent oxidoreductase